MNGLLHVKLVPLFLVLSCLTNAQKNTDLAVKPPMGWNSFDAFDCRINEDQFKKTVDFMAENLLKYGWNYAVIDYIWWHPSPGDWKAIRLNVRGNEEQRVTELYNIKTDPEETKNVADENQVLVRQFNELFISHLFLKRL